MARNRRVVFILNWHLRIGGVERKIVDLAQYISKRPEYAGCRVHLLLDEPPPEDAHECFFYHAVQDSRVRISWKPQERFWRFEFPLTLFILWKTLILRPEVILAFLRRLSVVAVIVKRLLWWRKIRVVISDDTITSMSLKLETPSPIKRSIVFRLIKKYYPGADLIVSPSETSRQDLVETFGIPKQKIAVNRNWVTDRHRQKPKAKIYDVIFVGRLEPEKDIASLLDILSEVGRSLSSFRACLVGKGTELAETRESLEKAGLLRNVKLAGIQADVNRFLDRAKIFCLTSRYEGFPISAIEAMARGLPVVTTAYPGAHELVRHGETGYVCESKADYVKRVVSLLDDDAERTRMGERAREYVLEHHGPEALERFAGLFMVAKPMGEPPTGAGG